MNLMGRPVLLSPFTRIPVNPLSLSSLRLLLSAFLTLPACALQASWVTDFADDFSGDLSKWEETGCASIHAGSLSICPDHDSIRQASSFGPWEDFRYEADIRIDAVAAGIVLFREDEANYLMLQFNAGSGLFRPHLRQNGRWTVLEEIHAPVLTGEWHHVEVEAADGWVTTSLDGEELSSFYHDATAGGGIGFRTGNSEEFLVDDLLVSVGEPPPPEPPSVPAGFTASPLHDGSPGIFLEWDGEAEAVDVWEVLLLPEDPTEAVRRQLLPGERTSVWLPVPSESGQWTVSKRAWKEGLASPWLEAVASPGAPAPPGFAGWIRSALPEGLPAGAYAPESDTDHDRVPALIEYAVDRDPLLPEFTPLFILDASAFPPEASLAVPVIPEDVELALQTSADLSDWSEAPTSPTNLMESESQTEQSFYRVKARAAQTAWLEARDLRVEHLRAMETAEVNSPSPLFSWALRSAERSGEQTACRVLVATAPSLLEPGTADVWDSGKQEQASPALRIPSGRLQSHTEYWWTVRLWNAADEVGSFAEPASFRTGQLDAAAYAPRPRQVRTAVAPVEVRVNAAGNTFIDFGRAAFGTVRLRVPGAAGGENVSVHLGEKKEGDDEVDRSPEGTIRYVKTTATLEPDGKWTTVAIPDYDNWPSIADMPADIEQVAPFRYVELYGLPAAISADDIEQLAVHTPWDEEASAFRSSDQVLNEVWELCKYSIKATSFASVYVDGDRERLPYEADAYINQLAHYGCEPAYALARFTHEWLIDHPTWPTEWKHHSILMAHADWFYTGDTASMERSWEGLKEKLFPGAEREDELVNPSTRDIVDWPRGERDGYRFVGYNTVVNAFQYRCLRAMAEMAEVLGKAGEAADFTARADQLYASFNAVFWDVARQLYTDGEGTSHTSLHANMFALAHGLVPEDCRDPVLAFIKGKGMACSVYGAHYLLEALFEQGEGPAAVELMRSTGQRSWFNMIRVGSTVTLEAWDIAFKGNLDWNHAWGAAPAAAIPRRVLGVRPLEPGFRVVKISPQPGPLTWIDGKVPTPLGPVEVRVSRDGDAGLTAAINAPAGCRLRIDLPVPPDASGTVKLDGEAVSATVANGRVRLPELPAGAWLFEVE